MPQRPSVQDGSPFTEYTVASAPQAARKSMAATEMHLGYLPAGLARFHERYGDAAEAQVADRTGAALSGIPATLAAIKKAAEEG